MKSFSTLLVTLLAISSVSALGNSHSVHVHGVHKNDHHHHNRHHARATAATPKTPKTVVIDGARMAAARAKLVAGTADASLKNSFANLKKDADTWVGRGPWSVLTKGTKCHNATSIRDYCSLAPYYWPKNAKTQANPLGCPYVNRDGQRNPAVDIGTDRQSLGKVAAAAPALAFAWYHSGHSAYAQHASKIIKTWFTDPATKMNPNLNFAQGIPCTVNGRSFGIIDFSQFYTSVIDAVAVLEAGTVAETGWNPATDGAAFRQWNTDFYHWLTDSDFGKAENKATNNHGVFADLQRAALASFLGMGDEAKTILGDVKTRIDNQITANGSQPQELARTRSWHYSVFTLVAFTRAAQVGTKLGVNLWSHKGPQGQSIFKAVDFLVPAATGAKSWGHPELNFTRFAALDVVHAASDAGDSVAHAAVLGGKLLPPPAGDKWYTRPAAEQLDAIAG